MGGCHPKTGEVMDSHTNADGTPWRPGKGTYGNLKKREAQGEEQRDSKFYTYVPEIFAAAQPSVGTSAKDKADEKDAENSREGAVQH